MACRCNLVKELRGQEAADYLREHLIELRLSKKSRKRGQTTVYECPTLHNEWEPNGIEGEGLVLTRVRMWVPIA